MKKILLTSVLTLSLFSGFSQQKIYIDPAATGDDSGSSWANAYPSFNFFLGGYIPSGNGIMDTLMVKAGTYKEAISSNVDLEMNLFIAGGFSGTEQYVYQANPDANPTVLDGDIDDDDVYVPFSPATYDDNLNNLIYLELTNADLHIEGFRFTGGFAQNFSGMNPAGKGGAIRIIPGSSTLTTTHEVNLEIVNCIFEFNGSNYVGGCISVDNPAYNDFIVNTIIDKCDFKNNYSFTASSCIFINSNLGSTYHKTIVSNSIFYNNFDENPNNPSVIYTAGSSTVSNSSDLFVFNNTFYENTGSPVLTWTGFNDPNIFTVSFKNNIVRGDIASDYAAVKIATGTNTNPNAFVVEAKGNFWEMGIDNAVNTTQLVVSGNSTADPLFTNVAGLDLSLQNGSPCIDNTLSDTVGIGMYYDGLDFLHQPRFVNGTLDAGAIEKAASMPTGIDELTSNEMIIFPNPNNGHFTLQLSSGAMVELMDINGKVISTYHLQSNMLEVSETLPAGMYLLREQSSGLVQKLIIE